jgi:hypothetical protein
MEYFLALWNVFSWGKNSRECLRRCSRSRVVFWPSLLTRITKIAMQLSSHMYMLSRLITTTNSIFAHVSTPLTALTLSSRDLIRRWRPTALRNSRSSLSGRWYIIAQTANLNHKMWARTGVRTVVMTVVMQRIRLRWWLVKNSRRLRVQNRNKSRS